MTRAFLRMARAQAATTALRQALDVVRRHPTRDAERRILEMIAAKRPVLEDWRRRQDRKRADVAETEYRKANEVLESDDV